MKFYSVSLPVWAHVVVLVQAESEEQAAEIASKNAALSDAEPIDFNISDDIDVMEVERADMGNHPKIYGVNGRVMLAKEK